jgi:hypothetical protein
VGESRNTLAQKTLLQDSMRRSLAWKTNNHVISCFDPSIRAAPMGA